MKIDTSRLQIRFVEAADWEDLLAIWRDFSKSPYAQYDRPIDASPTSAQSQTRLWAKVSPGKEHMFLRSA